MRWHPTVLVAYQREMNLARAALRRGAFYSAHEHVGRAHILGSHFCASHVSTHALMGLIAWRRRDRQGVVIQALRTVGALGTRALAPFFGTTGNPGTAEHRIAARYPVADDLGVLLAQQAFTHRQAPVWVRRNLARVWRVGPPTRVPDPPGYCQAQV